MWFNAMATEGQILTLSVVIPALERFTDVRMSVAVLGPNLTSVDDLIAVDLPDQVLNYANQTEGFGAELFKSPQDQSTCAHVESEVFNKHTKVVDGRCHYHEQFGDTNTWVLLDTSLVVPADGDYKIAMFEQQCRTTKAIFSCCAWEDDFETQYDLPESDCPFCGTSNTLNPDWLIYFHEEHSMAKCGGFPPSLVCTNTSIVLEPTPNQCPSPRDDTQPPVTNSNCDLTCQGDECQSHNVLGGCSYILNWNIPPTFDEKAEAHHLVVFKGDEIEFTNNGTIPYTLFELPSESSFELCDMSEGIILYGLSQETNSYKIQFDQPGDYYYAGGFGCPGTSFVMTRMVEEECDCTEGQKLHVQVMDGEKNLLCHNHAAPGAMEAPQLDCIHAFTQVYKINDPEYGAMDANECADFCVPTFALKAMDLEEGSCFDQGFTQFQGSQMVKPAISPMEVQALISTNLTCHCHWYEAIPCPEDQDEADLMYDEKVQEVETNCAPLLGGLVEECPLQCWQPMETLHLHYLECALRPVDEIYQQVNATGKCHMAATAPPNYTGDCPIVLLGRNALGDAASVWQVITALFVTILSSTCTFMGMVW
jgi:hypothetical protein